MSPITDFIQAKLSKLSAEHRGIKKPTQASHIERMRNAIESANRNLEKVAMLVDGVEVDADTIAKIKMKVPEAFRQKPVIYEATASQDLGGGFKQRICFSLEVTK